MDNQVGKLKKRHARARQAFNSYESVLRDV